MLHHKRPAGLTDRLIFHLFNIAVDTDKLCRLKEAGLGMIERMEQFAFKVLIEKGKHDSLYTVDNRREREDRDHEDRSGESGEMDSGWRDGGRRDGGQRDSGEFSHLIIPLITRILFALPIPPLSSSNPFNLQHSSSDTSKIDVISPRS
jgi:hypothetical protein